MPLRVVSRSERNVAIFEISGNLTLGPHLKTLQQSVRTTLAASPSIDLVVLDTKGVLFADSAGLGELTVLYTVCAKKPCTLALVGAPSQLQQILKLTRLDELLPSVPDLESAKRLIKK